MGGQWREQFKDTLVSAPLNLSQYQWALFAENEWRIVDDLALTLGARYDRNASSSAASGARAATWSGTPRRRGLSGRREQGYKTPDINLMTDGIIGLGAQGTRPLLGTATVRNQHLVGAGRGLRRRRRPDRQPDGVPHPLQGQARQPERGQLPRQRRPRSGLPGPAWSATACRWTIPQRVNVDSATIKGFELGGRVPLFEGWSFNANYTLTASEVTSGAKQGQLLGSQPRHALNLGLKWRVNDKFSTCAANTAPSSSTT